MFTSNIYIRTHIHVRIRPIYLTIINMTNKITPHPGVVLQSILIQRSIDMNTLAQATKMSASRIYCILNQSRNITADTALRLGGAFDICAEEWLRLQYKYDLAQAKINNPDIGKRVKRINKQSLSD